MKKRYDTTSNYVPAYPNRITRPRPAPPTQGASVFVAVVVVLLVILAVLAVGCVGLFGKWQDWSLQTTVLATLAVWGGAALVLLPWAIDRVIPVVENYFDEGDHDGGEE